MSHFDFEGRILVLFVPVPGDFLYFTDDTLHSSLCFDILLQCINSVVVLCCLLFISLSALA